MLLRGARLLSGDSVSLSTDQTLRVPMQLRTLINDDDAVSPVISVILMVAITVILAAVISVFVLGLGESTSNTAPQASFDFSYDETTGDVTVKYTNGDTINGDQLRFSGAALEKTSYGSITEWSGQDIEAGATATVNVEGGEALKVNWESSDGMDSATLGTYDVPETAGPSAGINSITIDTDGTSEVGIGSFSKVAGGSAYLKLVNQDGNELGTISNVQAGSTQDISSSVSNGDIVTAELYETSSETNLLASQTKGAEIVEYDLSDASNNGNDIELDVEGTNVGSEVWVEVIDDSGTDRAKSSDNTVVVSGGLDPVAVDNSEISSNEDLDIKIYESSSKNNLLDEITRQAGETGTT